jgi:hypothetical protein
MGASPSMLVSSSMRVSLTRVHQTQGHTMLANRSPKTQDPLTAAVEAHHRAVLVTSVEVVCVSMKWAHRMLVHETQARPTPVHETQAHPTPVHETQAHATPVHATRGPEMLVSSPT